VDFSLSLFGLERVLVRDYTQGQPLPMGVNRTVSNNENESSALLRAYTAQEALGTVARDNIIFGEIQTGQNRLTEYVFKAAIMTVSQKKHIVSTPIVGRNGSVHQYVSDGDYEIDIRGAIIEDTDGLLRLAELAEICQQNISLKIYSDFLSIFGISNIIINSFKFNQKEGYEKLFLCELHALSDNPINLYAYADN
jgi:Domain of unknown function (DUF6046)